MASRLNLQATLNWCGAFINFSPLLIGGMEPALSNANLILQTILGPPFCWRWNRNTTVINCVIGTQDYNVVLSDFGFIEKVWYQTANGTDIKEMEVKNCLSATKESARPKWVAAQSDDNNNTLTFRLNSRPSDAGIVTILYQKKPVLMSSLVSLWSPIPDEMSYIFNFGFLSLAMTMVSDPRFPIFNQRFTAHLLGAQDGLDELQKQIFLGNWLEITKAAERAQLRTQQGIAAKQS